MAGMAFLCSAPAALAAWRRSRPFEARHPHHVSARLSGLKAFGAACEPKCASRSVQGVSRAIAGRQQPWAGLLAETTTGLATVTPCDPLPLRRQQAKATVALASAALDRASDAAKKRAGPIRLKPANCWRICTRFTPAVKSHGDSVQTHRIESGGGASQKF